ncbi:phenazine biosynthesis protein PhzF family [Maribacter sedimenticola]|uniref:Phenazine biosynthesis protein PhzF family n=1 Tax=Maribacter sedimenticola TaxID=228956 RepID=A0ABY1SHP5_9FLAO|nr:PhzF family phenazine biosynthesis protein [Maribacter sedimenticola]SNR54812.1 phenazine biosynthesis protein PhzF family [Maribacter sedimenticola]
MDKSKKTVTVQILNAFAENGQGGNPAGVVLDADDLSVQDKLQISKQVGLSETAFVSTSKTEDFKLDFFTPTRQIAHCGHATVATFSYLKQLGKLKKNISSKETIDGKRSIELKGDLAFMEQLAPTYTQVDDQTHVILKSLGIQQTDLLPNAPIVVVHTGNSFLMVPVKDENVLAKLTPQFQLITELSNALNLIGYYVFAPSTQYDATARMFAPSYGILEESGTGMAAGPLACYLYDKLDITKEAFHIQQGKYMSKPSPSLIIVHLKLQQHSIKSVMAGGKGIASKKMKITINA